MIIYCYFIINNPAWHLPQQLDPHHVASHSGRDNVIAGLSRDDLCERWAELTISSARSSLWRKRMDDGVYILLVSITLLHIYIPPPGWQVPYRSGCHRKEIVVCPLRLLRLLLFLQFVALCKHAFDGGATASSLVVPNYIQKGAARWSLRRFSK